VTGAQFAGFRLAFAGLLLFLFGLGIGFAVSIFPAIKPLLSAHEAALGSGTFLIGIGAIWSMFMASEARKLVFTVWMSHYALGAALALESFDGAFRKFASPLLVLSCVAVAVTTFILIVRFWRETASQRAVVPT